MKKITYFINDDLLNPKTITEIEYLKKYFNKLVVVTQNPKDKRIEKLKNIHYVHLKKRI